MTVTRDRYLKVTGTLLALLVVALILQITLLYL